MIIRRTWQITDKYMLKQLGIYGILTSLILFLSVSGLNGFVSRVPEEKTIQGVFIGSDLQYDLYSFERAPNGMVISQQLKPNVFSHNPDYIEAVMNLHRIIEQMRPNENVSEQDAYHLTGDQRSIQIAYQLKDGSLLTRRYSFSFDEYKAYVLPVINQPDYKVGYYALDDLESYTSGIQITNPDISMITNNVRIISIDDPAKINKLKQMIIQQLKSINDPWHHVTIGNSLDLQITLSSDDGSVSSITSYPFEPDNKEMRNWLISQNLLSIATKPDDVQSIQILPDTAIVSKHSNNADNFREYKMQALQINDRTQIINLLNHSEPDYSPVPDSYILQLQFKSGIKAYRQLRSANITPELYSIVSR